MRAERPNGGQIEPQFWAIIKANMTPAGRPREEEFSDWYSAEHVPEWVAKDGFSWGVRLRRTAVDGQIGEAEHKYLAVYGIDRVASFNVALAEGPPWGPWDKDIDRLVCDWERTYYRVIYEQDPGPAEVGSYWALMKINLAPDADEAGFNSWYSEVHIPEITAHPGFHRAWRLQVEPDDNDLGPRRQEYWAVYEMDRPEALVEARQSRQDRGIPAWDGVWADDVRDVQLAFYEVICFVDRASALRT